MPQTVYWTGIYSFTYSFFVLYPFFFCLPPSSCFVWMFFLLPAAVAAVLCCNTEAEVSLAVMTHTVFSSAALQAQGCLYRCFSLDPFLPSSLCLSVCLNMSQCSVLLFSMSSPLSQNSWATSMFSCWGLRGHYHFLSPWVIAHRCFKGGKPRLFFLPWLKPFSVSVCLYFFIL